MSHGLEACASSRAICYDNVMTSNWLWSIANTIVNGNRPTMVEACASFVPFCYHFCTEHFNILANCIINYSLIIVKFVNKCRVHSSSNSGWTFHRCDVQTMACYMQFKGRLSHLWRCLLALRHTCHCACFINNKSISLYITLFFSKRRRNAGKWYQTTA